MKTLLNMAKKRKPTPRDKEKFKEQAANEMGKSSGPRDRKYNTKGTNYRAGTSIGNKLRKGPGNKPPRREERY